MYEMYEISYISYSGFQKHRKTRGKFQKLNGHSGPFFLEKIFLEPSLKKRARYGRWAFEISLSISDTFESHCLKLFEISNNFKQRAFSDCFWKPLFEIVWNFKHFKQFQTISNKGRGADVFESHFFFFSQEPRPTGEYTIFIFLISKNSSTCILPGRPGLFLWGSLMWHLWGQYPTMSHFRQV